jgi:hypothetical protein
MTERPVDLAADKEAAAELAFDREYHAWCKRMGERAWCGPACRVCGIARGKRALAKAVRG